VAKGGRQPRAGIKPRCVGFAGFSRRSSRFSGPGPHSAASWYSVSSAAPAAKLGVRRDRRERRAGRAGAGLVGARYPLPCWVRAALLGALAGVAAVVLPTLFVACALGGPSDKGQAPYLHAGLVYGVPVGLVAGGVAGLVRSRRRGRAEPPAAAGGGRETRS
jgi:hypothetical protein